MTIFLPGDMFLYSGVCLSILMASLEDSISVSYSSTGLSHQTSSGVADEGMVLVLNLIADISFP